MKLYRVDQGILYKRRKGEDVVVVTNEQEKNRLLRTAHNRFGHFGINGLFYMLQSRCWWPKMYEDVRQFVSTCETCQLFGRGPKLPPTEKSTWAPKIFETIALDFVGPFEETKRGNRFILTAIDEHSRFPFARPCRQRSAEEARSFLLEVVSLVGIPQYVLTDNDTCFTARVFEALCSTLNIQQRFSPAYHPQSNGKVERLNGTLVDGLRKKVAENRVAWDDALHMVLLGVRAHRHESTGTSPYSVVFGKEPTLGLVIEQLESEPSPRRNPIPRCEWRGTKSPLGAYSPGAAVMLKIAAPAKLGALWEGPYLIHRAMGPMTYQLRHASTGQLHRVAHADQIKPYRPRIGEDASR